MERSDAAVIADSVGAPAAFAKLFDRHARAVHALLARRLGHDRADELTSDVFRIAFERRGDFDHRYASARPWLLGIAVNLVRRELRTEQRRLRALAREAVASGRFQLPHDDIEARLDDEALAAALGETLAALSADDRDALLLVAWEDLSPREAAAALGVPAGTVRSRLHRARQQLRDALAALGALDGRSVR